MNTIKTIELDNHKLESILNRFNTKFRYRNNEGKELDSLMNLSIKIIDAKIKSCIYSNKLNSNIPKNHLIIKYKNITENEIISLNILLDSYIDILD